MTACFSLYLPTCEIHLAHKKHRRVFKLWYFLILRFDWMIFRLSESPVIILLCVYKGNHSFCVPLGRYATRVWRWWLQQRASVLAFSLASMSRSSWLWNVNLRRWTLPRGWPILDSIRLACASAANNKMRCSPTIRSLAPRCSRFCPFTSWPRP